MEHEEHLAWCKNRALEYANNNDLSNAIASMVSDLRKHESTNKPAYQMMSMIGMSEISKGKQAVIDWINGFN